MKPIIIAHRGASYVAPENTIAAFRAAADMGCDGIETDVQLSLDGKLMMYHNYSVDENSDGHGLISQMTASEIRLLDVGSWKGAEFAGERIPTLEECLDVARKSSVINIELKAPTDRRIPYVQPVAECIRASGLAEKIIVSAFDHTLLRDIKQVMPELKVGALTMPPMDFEGPMGRMLDSIPMDIPVNELKPEDIQASGMVGAGDNEMGLPVENMRAVMMELLPSTAALYPGLTLGQILAQLKKQSDLPAYMAGLDFPVEYLHCEFHSCLADPALVEKMHKMGIGVNPWTVDEEGDLRAVLAMGPDGIITNRPDILMNILADED